MAAGSDHPGTQRDDGDQVLQAVKFTDKKVPGLHLDLDEDFQTGCFTEIIRGYKMGVVEPDVMRGQQEPPELDVIIPSPTGLTPEKWKQTATLCPLDWPSNYSLLRLWHMTKGLHHFADQLRKQMNHRHMFSHWTMKSLRAECFASFRPIIFQKPGCSKTCRIVTSLAGECARSHLRLTLMSLKRNVVSFDGLPLLKS